MAEIRQSIGIRYSAASGLQGYGVLLVLQLLCYDVSVVPAQ